MHHLARRQIRQQIRRVAVLVSPVHDVRDLELHRDADGDQTDRRRLERVVRVGVFILNRRRRAVADEKILLPDCARPSKESRSARPCPRPACSRRKTSGFAPCDSGRFCQPATAISNARPPSTAATGLPKCSSTACSPASTNTTHVDKNKTASCASSSTGRFFCSNWKNHVSRNIEAELIIQRLRRRREQTFRLREQSDDAAVVKRARNFALRCADGKFPAAASKAFPPPSSRAARTSRAPSRNRPSEIRF